MNFELGTLKELVGILKEAKDLKGRTIETKETPDYSFQNVAEKIFSSIKTIVEKIETDITQEPARMTDSEKSTAEYYLKVEKEKVKELSEEISKIKGDLEREKFRNDLKCAPTTEPSGEPVKIKIDDPTIGPF